MSTGILVTPDQHLQALDELLRELYPRRFAPITVRGKLKAAGFDPNLAREPKPVLPAIDADFNWYERFLALRDHFEDLFIIATTPATEPICIPYRRRRRDREIPKAA